MRYKLFIYSLLLVLCLTSYNTLAEDGYYLINSPKLSFNISTKNDMYNGIVSLYEDPVKKKSIMYIKLNDTLLTSLVCNNKEVILNNPKVEDGFIDTSKYGKIKIGLHGPPPHKVIVWATKKQESQMLKDFLK